MPLIGVKEVRNLLGVCDKRAYEIMRELNKELEEKGYMTIRAKVPEEYLNERFYNLNGKKRS